MNRCRIPFEAILDYQEGRAAGELAERIQAHLADDCANCRRHLARWERLLGVMKEADRWHAPESVLERAYAILEERYRPPAPVPSLTTRIARLLFDSRTNLALAGARGEAGQEVQLVYGTEGYDVNLWTEAQENGRWYLIGQALAHPDRTAVLPEQVLLTAQDGTNLTATLETNEFHLEALTPGVYVLHVQLPDCEIVVSDVTVGA